MGGLVSAIMIGLIFGIVSGIKHQFFASLMIGSAFVFVGFFLGFGIGSSEFQFPPELYIRCKIKEGRKGWSEHEDIIFDDGMEVGTIHKSNFLTGPDSSFYVKAEENRGNVEVCTGGGFLGWYEYHKVPKKSTKTIRI